MAITDAELTALKEITGELLIKAFRGEVDLPDALIQLRDLTPADLAEEGADEEPPAEPGEPAEGATDPPAEEEEEKPEAVEPDPAVEADLSDVLGKLLPHLS